MKTENQEDALGCCKGSSHEKDAEKNPTRLQQQMLECAASVRQLMGTIPPANISEEDLFFPSKYFQAINGKAAKTEKSSGRDENASAIPERGFCNWLVPGKIMIGQYPGQNPLQDGPSRHEVEAHLKVLCQEAGISLFCSLQSETPAQDLDDQWGDDGKVYLSPESIREILPRPFTHYAPLARKFSSIEQQQPQPVFIHAPIEDLNVPESQEPLQRLLLRLLEFLCQSAEVENNGAMYIHCWGGRGRAGLVGACLVSLIWPTLDAEEILEWVQRGYATRLGHETMAEEFAYSPQTCQQREFVRQFVHAHQALNNTNSLHSETEAPASS